MQDFTADKTADSNRFETTGYDCADPKAAFCGLAILVSGDRSPNCVVPVNNAVAGSAGGCSRDHRADRAGRVVGRGLRVGRVARDFSGVYGENGCLDFTTGFEPDLFGIVSMVLLHFPEV